MQSAIVSAFYPETFYGDILLLELVHAVTDITPVALAPADFNYTNLRKVTAMGWGYIGSETLFYLLLITSLKFYFPSFPLIYHELT